MSPKPVEFRLPDIGEGIDGADIIEWRVAVGDHVEEDQELVEVQTDKAIVVIPSPATGVVTALGVAEGERLDVGAVLAVIEPDAAAAGSPPGAPPGAGRPLASPATRRRARELGVDLAAVAASGPQGRILREDVERAVNNYGGLGIWLGTPIILPPQVANFGVGAVRDRVVPIDGAPGVRPICALAVSGDHRVLDGDTLGAFVSQVVELLEEPLLIFEGLR